MNLVEIYTALNTEGCSAATELSCKALVADRFWDTLFNNVLLFGTMGQRDLKMELTGALDNVRNDLTDENVQNFTHRIFNLLNAHRGLGAYGYINTDAMADYWDEGIEKLLHLSELGAALFPNNSELQNFAGNMIGSTWQYQGTGMYVLDATAGGQNGTEQHAIPVGPAAHDIVHQADITKAKKYFEKGAALGCEISADNVKKAEGQLAQECSQVKQMPAGQLKI